MKKISSILVAMMIISIMSVMSFVSVSATDIGGNLLLPKDPGFETESWPQGMLNMIAHTGASSMQIGDETTQGYTNCFLNESLKPSTQYRISYYFKTLADDAINNKINISVMVKAGGVTLKPAIATDFFGNMPTFTLKTFVFNTPANLDAKIDAFNGFGVGIWAFKGILIDDASLVEIGPAPTAAPTASPAPLASSVTIKPVTDKTMQLSGQTTPGSTSFTLKFGTTTKTVVSNPTGAWTVNLSKALAVGTKITLTSLTTKVVYVGATAPTVASVTSKSKAITGKTYKAGLVTLKIGTKSYSIKASSTGAFKKTLTKTLKKGSKFTVKVKIAGQTSPIKTITVK